jgi:hypothetical protein
LLLKLKNKNKMIKKLLSIALIAGAVSANAQQLKIGKEQPSSVSQNLVARGTAPTTYSVSIDTLKPASVMPGGCAVGTNTVVNGLWNYVNDVVAPYDSGYVFGTGIIPIGGGQSTVAQELAQKYNVTGAATVTDVLVWAGHAKGTVTTTTAKIYSEVASTHIPNALLGTSAPVTMATYTVGGYTMFHFATAVNVPMGNFFAGVTVPAFGGTDKDTLSILSTKLGKCSSVDSCSAIKLGAPINAWYLVKVGFGQNCDLMIFPVININSVGINNSVSKGDLNLFAASPNPANNSININFSLNTSSKVDIEVIDLTGKIVKTIKGTDTFSNGKHAISVDLTNLESGSYFYSINASGSKIFSKFVVAK